LVNIFKSADIVAQETAKGGTQVNLLQAIAWLLKFLQRRSTWVFVWYR
jgi:undecaprenyl pyrophosphate phosphatase UppP